MSTYCEKRETVAVVGQNKNDEQNSTSFRMGAETLAASRKQVAPSGLQLAFTE